MIPHIPLKVVRKLHRRNEKMAEKLNAGGFFGIFKNFDEIDDEEDSDHGDDSES